ncbi:ATP-binding protein [Amaricoccus sp.]|uniref:sensor histidine kinase n=1 Tax=Amaricoccus sp. TaxID=1872485 RepID=UPI001B4115FF|nr:ATP-binding protein [Amaricoccus sp.]MBP7243121.1 sensor histidine kinase [Amaricoccus sp.]
MSDAAAAPGGRPAAFWMRLGLVSALVLLALVIWGGKIYLTRLFSEDQNADAAVRATLYAGSLQSAMQRHSVVPLLLSRDPILIEALEDGQFGEADERLTTFREEIGAGSIFLLDAGGRVVAASDDRPRGEDGSAADFFTLPMADAANNTAYSIVERPDGGGYAFHYSRRLVGEDGAPLGVIVVTVDLGLHEESWRRARVKVVVTDGEGTVLLASEPNWRGKTLANLLATDDSPSRVGQAIYDARRTLGSPSFVYIAGAPHLRSEVKVGFRSWTLTYFPTLEGVRAQVNAVLALIVMGFALLVALAFYLLSRRARAESRRIQRESDELRLLNRRLSFEMAARRRVERNLKDAEQSLEQASKLAALGQMSAAVSHELNQPLAAMKTYLAGARLLVHRRRPEEALSSFQRIDDLIDRMGGITRQLKSYARKGDGEFDLEPVDLRDSVRAALSMMAPQLNKTPVTITTTLPREPAVVMADALRIEQIIVNLLRNALDAVRGRPDRQIKIFLALGETVLLSIEDNGPGITAPDKLFEPFYTTKKPGEGLGLGLAISAGFAAELGGRLVARNAPDGGAVFELVLPRDRARSAPAQAAE